MPGSKADGTTSCSIQFYQETSAILSRSILLFFLSSGNTFPQQFLISRSAGLLDYSICTFYLAYSTFSKAVSSPHEACRVYALRELMPYRARTTTGTQ